MGDIAYLLLIAGFFGLCVLYVRGLDVIVRSAEEADAAHDATYEEAVQ
jgi:hypothetical protein